MLADDAALAKAALDLFVRRIAHNRTPAAAVICRRGGANPVALFVFADRLRLDSHAARIAALAGPETLELAGAEHGAHGGVIDAEPARGHGDRYAFLDVDFGLGLGRVGESEHEVSPYYSCFRWR